jgi:diguanylate cyclase (GGDEF)-like protein
MQAHLRIKETMEGQVCDTISREVVLSISTRVTAANLIAVWSKLIALLLDDTSSLDDLSQTSAELGRIHAHSDVDVESMIAEFLMARDFLAHRVGELLSHDELQVLQVRLDLALTAAVSGLIAALVARARCDGVTGLADRVSFDLSLHEEIERARRYETPFTLVIFDVDDFKSVNDRLGHIQGDRVLRSVAAAIVGNLRRSDRVFRFGGDEFAAICLGDARSGIARAIARVERAVTDVGISSGSALFPDDARDATTLISVADERMFERKRDNGRNGKGTEKD